VAFIAVKEWLKGEVDVFNVELFHFRGDSIKRLLIAPTANT
jgi:hypothetical protein